MIRSEPQLTNFHQLPKSHSRSPGDVCYHARYHQLRVRNAELTLCCNRALCKFFKLSKHCFRVGHKNHCLRHGGREVLTKTRIRSQLHVAIIVTVLMMMTLSFVSFNGSLEFRSLTKSIRGRANELPLVANIGVAVSDLRSALWEITSVNGDYQFAHIGNTISPITFMRKLDVVSNALKDYRHQLERIDASDSLIADHSEELKYVDRFQDSLARIYDIVDKGDWVFETSRSIDSLEAELENLQRETSRLPGFLSARMDEFANNARSVYHWWIALTLIGLSLACASAAWLYFRFNRQVSTAWSGLPTEVDA